VDLRIWQDFDSRGVAACRAPAETANSPQSRSAGAFNALRTGGWRPINRGQNPLRLTPGGRSLQELAAECSQPHARARGRFPLQARRGVGPLPSHYAVTHSLGADFSSGWISEIEG